MLGHRQQNAPDMQSGVDFALHAGNRICQLRHTNHRERLRLHRDDDLVGSGKTVEDRPPTIGKDYNDTLVQVTQEYQKHCISLDDILEEETR